MTGKNFAIYSSLFTAVWIAVAVGSPILLFAAVKMTACAVDTCGAVALMFGLFGRILLVFVYAIAMLILIARRCAHAASLWLDYTFPEDTALEGFGLGGGVRYVGQRYGDIKNTLDLDAVTLFDAAVHYKKDNVTASLNFKNLADKDYVASCSSFGCTYGDGRTVMGKLTFQW